MKELRLPEISETSGGAMKLAVLTAAIGAGFAGPAHAGFISTDSSGPTTFSLSGPGTSQSFDLNGDGIADYTISVTSGSEIAIDGGANQVDTFAGYADSFASLSDFVPPQSLKTTSGSVPIVTYDSSTSSVTTIFTPGTPGYLELLFAGTGGQEYVGYIEGTLMEPAGSLADSTFTVSDYGYDTVPVPTPEPGSLALLAAGLPGLLALRRRRRREMRTA